MEAAGLVVGVFALVGIFEDCVSLISQIGIAKSMSQDYMRLETKLDFQKLFLLQWADRLNLFYPSYDKRLDDLHIRAMVERGLRCIHALLLDSAELKRRYGIRPIEPIDEVELLTSLSARLMTHFRKNTHNLRMSLEPRTRPGQVQVETRENPYPAIAKIKWVIKDKEAFESLIRELSDLVASLDKVLPPKAGSSNSHAILENEIRGLRDVDLLKRIQHASMDDISLWAAAEEALSRECSRKILNRLWFRLIDDRKNSINEKHADTFKWALRPSGYSEWSNLNEWLRLEHGIYWISGKPGSGKSTLIKFLFESPEVAEMLKEWAGERRLTIAAFFLWNPGSAEQNTQQGLARGLLYHVLDRNRSLIPIVLPGMWKEAQDGTAALELPLDSEIREAFRLLGNETTNGAYAFFIDGLDEFKGSHRVGIEFVQKLIESSNIKLILASRPIDTCVAAFSSKPNLRLQDLTKDDIRAYIKDTLRTHPYVAELGLVNEHMLGHLMGDLQRKARGVFLWVILACRTLIEGFEAYDSVKELQLRVNELPGELEELFRHILRNIPQRFLHQTAKLLRTCYQSRLLGVTDTISAFALAWAEEKEFDVKALSRFEACSDEGKWIKRRRLEGRLRSRCMGLLEIHGGLVDFMHRTVFDFLNSPDVWTMECLRIVDERFEATTVLSYMSAYLLYVQEQPLWRYSISFWETWAYLDQMQQTAPSSISDVLKCVAKATLRIRHEKSVNGRVQKKEFFFGANQHELALDDAGLILAIECGLTHFVASQDLRSFVNPQPQEVKSRFKRYPVLYHATRQPLTFRLDRHKRSRLPRGIEMIRLLLGLGCDPNQEFHLQYYDKEPTSTWESWLFVRFVLRNSESDSTTFEAALFVVEVTLLLLQAGARINTDLNELQRTLPKHWEKLLEKTIFIWLEKDARFWCLGDKDKADLARFTAYCQAILTRLQSR